MSTNYYFHCTRCKETGGFFSRQAWGWGNADIVDTFKFLMAHTRCTLACDESGIIRRYEESQIKIISEHDDRSEEDEERWLKHREEEEVMGMFPASNDWTFVAELIAKETEHGREASQAWLAREKENT